MSEQNTLTIELLDKSFQVKCPESSRQSLQEAAHYLNDKMREVRDHGRVIGSERITMMAALNICYELLELKSQRSEQLLSPELLRRLESLQKKIDVVLVGERQKQLEFDAVEES
jgi:cell division protein ZapA